MSVVEDWEESWEERQKNPYRGRSLLFRGAIILAFLALLGQLWRLQILEGSRYRAYADENRLRLHSIEAPRGVIYDRHGTQLVSNVPSFTIALIPAGLPKSPKEQAQVIGRLATFIGLAPADLQQRLAQRQTDDFTPIPLKTQAPYNLVAALEERQREFPGATVLVEPIRDYREGYLTAHLLGYARRITQEQYEKLKAHKEKKYGLNDKVGETGLELTFEGELRGGPGEQWLEVDSTERPVRTLEVRPPVPGRSLVLALDLDLQRQIAAIFAPYMDQYRTAVALAMDPRNGQILALVSLPSYDNNLFSRGLSPEELEQLLQDPRRPLLNKAISGAYPPGSTFKIVPAAAALQEGVVDKSFQLYDPGYLRIPREYRPGYDTLRNWAAHGWQDMVAALANSCNVYFYQMAGGEPEGRWQGLGQERLARYARAFGLGSATGLDLPGEVAGIVPDAAWKERATGEKWVKGDTYIYGIGQGFLAVTPLQMLNAYAAVANGGTLYRPQLVLELRDSEGRVVRPFEPQIIRRLPVAPEHLRTVQEGLRAGMLGPQPHRTPSGASYIGTAWTANIPEIQMAGKTGTAESFPDAEGKYHTHGWFAAYAPAENPQIAVLVFVERGRGPQDAAQRAKEILSYYFNKRR